MQPREIVWSPIKDVVIHQEITTSYQPFSNIAWKPFDVTGQLLGIVMVFVCLAIFCLIYWAKTRKIKTLEINSSFVLIVQMLILWVQDLTIELLGEKNRKFTPFFLLLVLYIAFSNIISLIGGVANPTSSLTVTFSLALTTFIGMIVVGIKYQRWNYLKNFIVKLEIKGKVILTYIPHFSNIISEIMPLFSLSLRLWGNILSGGIIIALLYNFWFYVFSGIDDQVLALSLGSIFGGVFTSAVHLYFDLAIGCLQAYVFLILTYNYWAKNLAGEENANADFKQLLADENTSDLAVRVETI